MKLAQKYSVLLNVLLAGSLILIWTGRQKQDAAPAPSVQLTTPPLVASIVTPPPQAAPRAEAAPFRWNQMDAKDYHVYVKNLRAIGCPETTLRAIVSADVQAAYRVQMDTLHQKLSDLASASWSTQISTGATESDLKTRLQNIPVQEAALIADLLGLKPVASPLAGTAPVSSSMPAAEDEQVQTLPSVSLPLVFQKIDPVAYGLDDEQMKLIEQLRQSFVDKVGGPNQDPDDPAYLARWQQAQPFANDMLRGLLGRQNYSKFLLQQVLAESQASSSSPQ